jgi:hypothetical protein
MKIIRSFLAFPLLCFSFIVNAQSSVSGRIIDSTSREPLAGASVFFQNTTIGTATNKQGEFSLPLRSGGYDLIVTYSGNKTHFLRITSTENVPLEIEMIKEEKNLEEVVNRSSNEVPDGWEKYGSFFIEHFIGTTPFASQCQLENREALKFYFYKRSNKLKILAEAPLLISNKALGYNLTDHLDSFVHYYETNIDTYRGFCLYSEMEGALHEIRAWNANRKNAYYGSRLHFMRSYYDSTLIEDGFTIDLLTEEDNTKFRKVEQPFDSVYYGALDSTFEIEIWYPRKFSVTYAKKRPEPEYLKKMGLPKKVATQISYIELRDAIVIKENGYYYDQKAMVMQGYWSWKNIADQLPYDYSP